MTEEYAAGIVNECDEKLRKSFFERSLDPSTSSASTSCSMGGDGGMSGSETMKRKRLLDRDLLAMEMISIEEFEIQDLEGRISGDADWK